MIFIIWTVAVLVVVEVQNMMLGENNQIKGSGGGGGAQRRGCKNI